MACDRFVHFRKKVPSYDDIKHLLEDYVRGVGKPDFKATSYTTKQLAATWSRRVSMEGWGVSLPGKPSFPFKRVKGFERVNIYGSGPIWPDERWFEVVVYRKGKKVTDLDVITRLADEMTTVICEGFVSLCVRCWKAKVDR